VLRCLQCLLAVCCLQWTLPSGKPTDPLLLLLLLLLLLPPQLLLCTAGPDSGDRGGCGGSV
jgi:hypothetical protein